MPRSKKAKAAKMREAAKKLARQSAQALLYPFSLNQLPNADTPDLNNGKLLWYRKINMILR